MNYRAFPKIPDLRISALGFGCMRLATLNGDAGQIDDAVSIPLVREAIDAGVNYVDTAYPYHNGQSEPFLARALADGYRERVQLATKHPTWLVNSEADWERYLDEQLAKLKTDHIDFYLIHSLNAERWETVLKYRGLPALERARADGRIRHIGFSFHGARNAFKTIIDGYDWEFAQIQYNFLDEDYQAGTEGLRYAADRRIGIVVMEPLRGGALATAPAPIQAIWNEWPVSRSPAEWALRWVWNRPEVVTVLSGMHAQSELRENLAVAASAAPGSLTAAELALIDRVRARYHALIRVPCTTCGYCEPCPQGVSIPDVFSLYNASVMLGTKQASAAWYQRMYVGDGAGGDACTACHECEEKCPQAIEIPDKLAEAHAFLMS